MRSLAAASLLLALVVAVPAVPAFAGNGSNGDNQSGQDKPFPGDDPTAGRVGVGTSATCGNSDKVGGPCLSAGSVGQVTAPLPPGLVVVPGPASAPGSGQ
jgi:hypothetical protein